VTSFELMPPPAYDVAPSISMIEGEIVVIGPGAVAFSMTRDAAEETHRRLGEALKNESKSPQVVGPARSG
jgi:hypothetical protein